MMFTRHSAVLLGLLTTIYFLINILIMWKFNTYKYKISLLIKIAKCQRMVEWQLVCYPLCYFSPSAKTNIWCARYFCTSGTFINHAAMGRARFMFYPWFIIIIIIFFCWWPDPNSLAAKFWVTQCVMFICQKLLKH